MPYQTDEDRVRHEAVIRREDIVWEKYHDHMMNTDMGAVDIGLTALKTAVFINAGALVTLITFIGQLWNLDGNVVNAVLHASHSFVYGVIFGGASFAVAYFYQSGITAVFNTALKEIPLSQKPVPKKLHAFVQITAIMMILLAVASLAEFTCGSTAILEIFENAAQAKSEANFHKQASNPSTTKSLPPHQQSKNR